MQGDAYKLIMHIERTGFSEAQKKMAEILGIPTFAEYIGKSGVKIRRPQSKPFPVNDRVLSLLGLQDDTSSVLSERSQGWVNGDDPEHCLKGKEASWILEDSKNQIHYLIGQQDTISLKRLWNEGNYLFVHRVIKGKVSEKFQIMKQEYNSNKWNDKNSNFYQKYLLHDILEEALETLKEVGEMYGMELSYRKTPTYS